MCEHATSHDWPEKLCVSTLNTVPHRAGKHKSKDHKMFKAGSQPKPLKALEPLNTPPFCQNYLQICDFCKEQILVSFHKLLFSTSLMFHRSLQTQVVKPWKHRWTWVEPRNAQHAISCLILWHSEQLPGLSKGSAFSCLLERQARSPPSVISSHAENSASQWHFSFSGWNYGE